MVKKENIKLNCEYHQSYKFLYYIHVEIVIPAPIIDDSSLHMFPNKEWYHFGDEVHFECQNGFDLVGNRSIVLQEDQTWSSSPPHCSGR